MLAQEDEGFVQDKEEDDDDDVFNFLDEKVTRYLPDHR